MNKPKIYVIGGGTMFHVRPHLSLCAPAYGTTAKEIHKLISLKNHKLNFKYNTELVLTKMATSERSSLETNEDLSKFLDNLTKQDDTKIIFMSAALCDYDGYINAAPTKDVCKNVFYERFTKSGKHQPRLKTSDGGQILLLEPAEKLIKNIRKIRKDIFLVGFKTTAGATEEEQYEAGLNLLKKSSCNLVLANDIHTRVNMIVTPEMAKYSVTTDRERVLHELVYMALERSQGTFTRTVVESGKNVPWNSPEIPDNFRTVINHCIKAGAYKAFNGVTVGHFAVKIDDKTFLSSRRKTDFNDIENVGMVKVHVHGNQLIAEGSKPSAGARSQYMIFEKNSYVDCIFHAHIPLKPDHNANGIIARPQKQFECGSHECGLNTSTGMTGFPFGIQAVMLDKHGPNIAFNSKTDPKVVIRFIEDNFDLSKRTE